MEISIIGGGITGLTTALALHKVDIQSKVYEQAYSLNEIGAGIWLQPNALQVLNWLGIHQEIEVNGCVLNKMEITYPNLKPIKRIISNVVADRYGNQTIAIHRGKLQRILYDQCERLGLVELGMSYTNHVQEGNKTLVHFENKNIQTDVVLGADGIKSKVRECIGQPSEYRLTGQICCRGIANMQLPDQLQKEGKEIWGNKVRFGFSQLSDDSVYFFIVMSKELCPEHITKESLSTLFRDFDPIVNNIVSASEEMHIAELTDLKRLDSWHNKTTCLLGDAAHATTPNMGQGACQGIEDAYYISKFLKGNTPVIAFEEFEKNRRKKVDYVVNNSWNFGQLAHNRVGQMLLKAVMKLTPEKVMSKQMNKLYSIEGL